MIRRVIYARDFPPIEESPPGTSRVMESKDQPSGSESDSVPSVLPPSEESTPMPDATAPAAAPVPADVGPAKIKAMDMDADDFFAGIAAAVHAGLMAEANAMQGEQPNPEEAPTGGDVGTPYEASPAQEKPPVEENREQYAAAEPGCNNVFAPGMAGDDKEKRRMYEQSEAIRRVQQDQRIKRLEDENAAIIDELMATRFEKRRLNYERDLVQCEAEGFEIDRVAELEALTPETPPDYEDAHINGRIRKFYRRSAANTNGKSHVDVAAVEVPAHANGKAPKGKADLEAVFAHLAEKGMSPNRVNYEKAKVELGLV